MTLQDGSDTRRAGGGELFTLFAAQHKMHNLKDEKGATMIEYALLLSLIAMFIIPGIVTLSESMSNVFLAAGGSEGTDILTGESDPGTGASAATDPVIVLRN